MALRKGKYKNPEDFTSIKKIISSRTSVKTKNSYEFAKLVHKGRIRFSGKPFLDHVEKTADNILTWLSPKILTKEVENLICAAILHDSVEYEKVDIKIIEKKFGKDVKNLVAGVSDLRSNGSEKVEVENLRFIAKRGYLDPRVFVIKLADRLHNMRTHKFLPKEKQGPKARETLNVYAPLAETMGMWQVKKELEDLCFYYLQPKIYRDVKNEIKKDPRFSEKFDQRIIKKLEKILKDSEIKAEISTHINGLYATYSKREKAINLGTGVNKGFLNISDAKNFSVTIPSENTLFLYILMGLLHSDTFFQKYVDITRIKDYITKPQPNKYSALQTTLNLPEGKTEILFTTKKREDFNNKGIIALLKEGVKDLSDYRRKIIFDEEKIAWFLPTNATYYDFVYLTGVGPQASYVLVNGSKKRLKENVENGSMVRVVFKVDGKRKVDESSLKYTLPKTKLLIERQINLAGRDDLIKKGKSLLENILAKRGLLDLTDVKNAQNAVVYTLLVEGVNDLYLRIASGNFSTEKVSEILDRFKITKENLGFTTLRITGKNRPGVLSDVSKIIKEKGGNIHSINQTKNVVKKSDIFILRILIKGLSKESEIELKKILSKDKRLKKVEIV